MLYGRMDTGPIHVHNPMDFEEPITFLNTTKYKHSSSNGNTRTITEEPHLLRNTFFIPLPD